MRGAASGLGTPHPLGATLPALYRDDSFTQRLCEALDDVLAPVICVLDCFPAYLDLTTAPGDTLPWLAHWLGLDLDPAQRSSLQRQLLRAAIDLQGWQGTRRGIEQAVHALFGVRVDVRDSGDAAWSTDSSHGLPGSPTPQIVVELLDDVSGPAELQRIRDVVDAVTPAHVHARVEPAGE